MQFQVAPGSTTAARTCAASAAGTVRVMREPETLTGIEYSKADPPACDSINEKRGEEEI